MFRCHGKGEVNHPAVVTSLGFGGNQGIIKEIHPVLCITTGMLNGWLHPLKS